MKVMLFYRSKAKEIVYCWNGKNVIVVISAFAFHPAGTIMRGFEYEKMVTAFKRKKWFKIYSDRYTIVAKIENKKLKQ